MWRFALVFGVLSMVSFSHLEAFNGSFAVQVNQRNFKDERFGPMNGFKKLKPEFEIVMGLHEFYPRIEPIFSVGYVRSRATACAVEEDGFDCLPADQQVGNQDRFETKLLKFGLGAQWKAWEPDYFPLIPRVSLQANYRHVWLKKETANEGEQNKLNGGDVGLEIGGGFLWSFMYDQKRRSEMESEWGLKDFGLALQAKYLMGGLLKTGLGGIDGTGGWSFGAGLVLDW